MIKRRASVAHLQHKFDPARILNASHNRHGFGAIKLVANVDQRYIEPEREVRYRCRSIAIHPLPGEAA